MTIIELAALPWEGGAISSVPKGGLSTLPKILGNAITLFIVAGSFLFVIYIVWAGIQWITSGGDKAKLAAAQGRLTWALIGFISLLFSFFIINTIGYFFKLDLLKLT